ncbi:hypothetical protein [Nocardia wallacei]|uniref:hypothetical protein n=1 Tax=Nocardia wallacei TaxID=480035 RepID=UPI002458B06F|nr:hypothetical protein [Nocardia wallacei]
MSAASTPRGDRYDWERARGMIVAFGQRKTLAEWSKDPRCVVKREALRTRLAIGWKAEDALTRPKHERPTMEFTHEGRTMTLLGWAKHSGIKYKTLYRRITTGGMTFADALAKGPEGAHFLIPVTAFGETKPMYQWAYDARAQCSVDTLRRRLREGWDPEQAITHEPRSRSTLGTGVPFTAFGQRRGLQDWARLTHIPAEVIRQRMVGHDLTLEAALHSLGWTPHDTDHTAAELIQIDAEHLQPGDTIMAVTTTPGHRRFTVRRIAIPASDPE